MDRISILDGERISLVVPEVDDVKIWQKGINDIEIGKNLVSNFGNIISYEEELEFYKTVNHDKDKKTFSIFLKDEGRVIGNVYLGVNQLNRNGVLGIAIFEKNLQSKGLGAEVIELIKGFAFDILGLNKVSLSVLSTNERAIKCYTKTGFVEVGRFKEEKYLMGQYIDLLKMEIMRTEYESKNKTT